MASCPRVSFGKSIWPVRLLAAGVLVLAAVVLTGWALNNPLLQARLSTQHAMMPNAALGMALAAIALLLVASSTEELSSRRRWAVLSLAGAAGMLGATTLTEYLLRADLGIDQMLVRVSEAETGSKFAGRMAPQAALGLLLLGAALCCLTRRRLLLAAQVSAALVTLGGMFNLVGFVYGAEAFYSIGILTPTAMAAAAGLMVLGLGVLFVRREAGLMRPFTSDAPGIHIINRLLFAILMLPILLDWVFSKGENAGLYGRATSEAFAAVGAGIILMVLAWHAGAYLISVNGQLEHRVALRTAQLENVNLELKREVEQHKHAEVRIRYLNRVYSVLSDINQSIVREHDLMKLYESVCRTAIEKGGFYLAWIGLVDKESNSLRVIARAGAADDFIEKLPPALGGNASESAAAAEGWEAGARLVCNDLVLDPRMARWRDDSMRRGFRALASISLYSANEVIGSFSLVAGESDSFNDEELRLLDELALDISYAGEVEQLESLRRQAEDRIRGQVEAMDLAPVAITIYDAGGAITYCNSISAALFGFKSPKEMLGRRTEDVFSAETEKVFAPARAAVLADGIWHGEPAFVTRDGRAVVTSHYMRLLRDSTGRPMGRISIAADITDKKRLEDQALRAQRLENLGMLAAGIAHDFNNALAPIAMAGPLLRMQVSDPAGLRILDIVEQSSARGAALVRQILSFAHGKADGKQLIQLRHVLQEVIDLSRSSFPKSVRIEPYLPNDLWPVLADPTQMHQVFLNLCVNARDAMPEGGEITLAAGNRVVEAAQAAKIEGGRTGDFLAVDVRDTGTGIPPEVLKRIFDPFFTTKGEGKGTGLGLSTVRAIVSNHDGFLTVQTSTDVSRGHGTVFTIYLPAAPGEAAEPSSTQPGPVRRGRGELILFVDDEQPVLDIGAKILVERGGYQVITAHNGAEAAAAFVARASEVRLLMTDLDMPTVDGRHLARALRIIKPGLPVIAMSGGASEAEEGVKAFATAYLAKPFEAQKLLEIVYRTLRGVGSASPFPNKA